MTFFEIFDIDPIYSIDDSLLKTRYLSASRLYHPDRFIQKSEEEQTEAEEKYAMINKAYSILSNPETRLKYILELHHKINSEETNALDQDFLIEMMDINDLILDEPDAAKLAIAAKTKELQENAYPFLQSYSFASATDFELNHLRNYYYKKRYLWRLTRLANGDVDL